MGHIVAHLLAGRSEIQIYDTIITFDALTQRIAVNTDATLTIKYKTALPSNPHVHKTHLPTTKQKWMSRRVFHT